MCAWVAIITLGKITVIGGDDAVFLTLGDILLREGERDGEEEEEEEEEGERDLCHQSSIR